MAPTSTSTTDTLRSDLHRAARRSHRIEAISLTCCLLSAALLAFAAVFVCDWLTPFPAPVRVLLTTVVLLAAAVWGPCRFRSVWRRERSVVRLARQVERAAAENQPGGFRSLVVSALEFGMGRGTTGSEELKQRVVERAGEPRFSPSSVRLHHAALVKAARRTCGAACAVYALWLLLGWPFFVVFWLRAMGLPHEYPTRTVIVAVEHPEVCALLDTIAVRVRAAGELPPSGRLIAELAGESPFELSLEADEARSGWYAASIESATADVEFQILLGDARSARCRVRVVQTPHVESGTIELQPPPYTGVPARTLPLSNVDIPEHSRFSVRVRADRPLQQCELDLGATRRALTPTDDGTYELVDAQLEASCRYSIRLVDTDGIENSDRVFYAMSVVPDRPPVVQLEKPENDRYWAPVSRVRWRVRAFDDYGMADAYLHCQIAELTESGKERVRHTREIPIEGVTGEREAVLTGVLPLLDLDVRTGQIVILRACVRDACDVREKPQVGASRSCRLHIVSAEELRRIIEEEEQLVARAVEDLAADVQRQVRVLEMQEQLGR